MKNYNPEYPNDTFNEGVNAKATFEDITDERKTAYDELDTLIDEIRSREKLPLDILKEKKL